MKNGQYSIHRRIIIIVLIPFSVLLLLLVGMYAAYETSVRQQAQAAFDSLVEQRKSGIEEKLAGVQSAAESIGYSEIVQQYLVDMDAQERLSIYSSIRQNFNMLIGANPVLRAVYISDNESVFLESNSGFMYLFERANSEYRIAENPPATGFYTRPYAHRGQSGLSASRYCVYYMPVGVIQPISQSREAKRLTCAVLFDAAELLDTDSAVQNALEALVWNDELIASNTELTPESTRKLIAAAHDHGARSMPHEGKSYYLHAAPVSTENGLEYIFMVPTDGLAGDLHAYLRSFLLLGAGCAVAMVFLLIGLRRSISAPVNEIAMDMRQITLETVSIQQSRAKELAVLTSGVNKMLSWLQKMRKQELDNREQAYQLNLRRMQAEMLAYRSQINPHFLMNTLECMSGMARYYHVQPLEEVVTAMSGSFRYTLRAPDIVELKEEIGHFENYMRIMEIRSPGRYRLILRAREDTLRLRVLSLMLQPLAENAVEHGFNGFEKDAPCTLLLMTRVDEDKNRLHIRLADNGNGMSEEELDAVRRRLDDMQPTIEKHHVALNNIHRRLKITYGDDGCMEITSRKGFYTCVDLYIPLGGAPRM
ncbi:MAG: histidine kinase [Clostridia bacterium]|nr:histidine kinase [Clostridia bacterium]